MAFGLIRVEPAKGLHKLRRNHPSVSINKLGKILVEKKKIKHMRLLSIRRQATIRLDKQKTIK
jgi:hypothetical protein